MITVTDMPAVISTQNQQLVVRRDNTEVLRHGWAQISAIVLYGYHQVTTQAMHTALEDGIAIHLANGSGWYKGMICSGIKSANHRLWLRQAVAMQQPALALDIARDLVQSRLIHMLYLLGRRRGDSTQGAIMIQAVLKRLNRVQTLQSLRGHEGLATRELFKLLANQTEACWGFHNRNRRPPRDPINVLLSIGYTQVYAYSETAIRVAGLSPWQGVYHQPHGAHAVLASDLMEPFRGIVEQCAMRVVNRRQIKPDHFSYAPNGACRIDDTARRIFLAELGSSWSQPIRSVGDEKSYSWRVQILRQARSLRRWVDGEAAFKPFRIRR
ncbi:CRISPR-associated endonuclease Cas1 [Gammaproteobacteria bacterium]|nr:CRISPR-associated endonuclease Cas1 [Gammaproteobacteria bacterium]